MVLGDILIVNQLARLVEDTPMKYVAPNVTSPILLLDAMLLLIDFVGIHCFLVCTPLPSQNMI